MEVQFPHLGEGKQRERKSWILAVLDRWKNYSHPDKTRMAVVLRSIVPKGIGRVMLTSISNRGFKAAGFGGVALFAVIYYASGIPKVQQDILQVRLPLSQLIPLL